MKRAALGPLLVLLLGASAILAAAPAPLPSMPPIPAATIPTAAPSSAPPRALPQSPAPSAAPATPAPAPIQVTGQLLAYQDGYVFFTTGDGFRVAPGITIENARTGKPSAQIPGPRLWARATFDPAGEVTAMAISRSPLPPEGNFADVEHFAVALSSPVPNPDLNGVAAAHPEPGITIPPGVTFSGKPVLVTFTVEVPPTTPQNALVYMTNDVSGWNPQAIEMTRVDALHYRVQMRLRSGTIFSYLYDRGSLQSEEAGENGLQRKARQIIVYDSDVRAVNDVVYNWQDTLGGNNQPQPNVIPTPYNPAPFPNLPPGMPPPSVPPVHPPR